MAERGWGTYVTLALQCTSGGWRARAIGSGSGGRRTRRVATQRRRLRGYWKDPKRERDGTVERTQELLDPVEGLCVSLFSDLAFCALRFVSAVDLHSGHTTAVKFSHLPQNGLGGQQAWLPSRPVRCRTRHLGADNTRNVGSERRNR